MHTHSRFEDLSGLAGRQSGVVSIAQLRALGLSDKGVERLRAKHHLHRLYRGVYAVGHTALTRRGRELAAVLACGRGASLSHLSAGFAWHLVKRPAREIHVSCRRSRPPGPAVVVHRSRLDSVDSVQLDGVPVTTVARTLLDLADLLTETRLAGAIEEAETKRVFDLRELDAAQARAPHRLGRHKLQRVLERWRPPPFTRAKSERLFLALCKRYELPRPVVNSWIGEQEVDFYWERQRVAVEVDGSGTHLTRKAFEEDRRRDRRLAVMGIQVLRVTWYDLHHHEAEVAAQVKAVLTARSPC